MKWEAKCKATAKKENIILQMNTQLEAYIIDMAETTQQQHLIGYRFNEYKIDKSSYSKQWKTNRI